MRPLDPSMRAGLPARRSACRKTYSVMVTSGIVTSGLLLLVIVGRAGA
jgi:hypothetical protein